MPFVDDMKLCGYRPSCNIVQSVCSNLHTPAPSHTRCGSRVALHTQDTILG